MIRDKMLYNSELEQYERYQYAITKAEIETLTDDEYSLLVKNVLSYIAEAEEEKSLATVKSFERFGEEAKLKKQLEEDKSTNRTGIYTATTSIPLTPTKLCSSAKSTIQFLALSTAVKSPTATP